MGNQGSIGDRLRHQLRSERERRGWSQQQVADAMAQRYKFDFYGHTISKIESGERAVRADELIGFAEIFGMSADSLAGRRAGSADVMWAASKLSSNAHKMLGEILSLRDRLYADYEELFQYAKRDQKCDALRPMLTEAEVVVARLNQTHGALSDLAKQFPLPGRMT